MKIRWIGSGVLGVAAIALTMAFKTHFISANSVRPDLPLEDKSDIIFVTTVVDVGMRSRHAGPVEAKFDFVNRMGYPIYLQSVHTSCGCTTSDFSPAPLAAGETGSVRLTVKTASVGPFEHSALLTFVSDHGKVQRQIDVKGSIIEPFVLSPWAVDLKRSGDGPSVSGTCTIYNNTDDHYTILKTSVVGAPFRVEGLDHQQLPPRSALAVVIRADPVKSGLAGYLSVDIAGFDGAGLPFPPLHIPVTYVDPDTQLLPPRITMGVFTAGQKVTVKSPLVNFDDRLQGLEVIRVLPVASDWTISGKIIRSQSAPSMLVLDCATSRQARAGPQTVRCRVCLRSGERVFEVSVDFEGYCT